MQQLFFHQLFLGSTLRFENENKNENSSISSSGIPVPAIQVVQYGSAIQSCRCQIVAV
jgi:hypothetical protein